MLIPEVLVQRDWIQIDWRDLAEYQSYSKMAQLTNWRRLIEQTTPNVTGYETFVTDYRKDSLEFPKILRCTRMTLHDLLHKCNGSLRHISLPSLSTVSYPRGLYVIFGNNRISWTCKLFSCFKRFIGLNIKADSRTLAPSNVCMDFDVRLERTMPHMRQTCKLAYGDSQTVLFIYHEKPIQLPLRDSLSKPRTVASRIANWWADTTIIQYLTRRHDNLALGSVLRMVFQILSLLWICPR